MIENKKANRAYLTSHEDQALAFSENKWGHTVILNYAGTGLSRELDLTLPPRKFRIHVTAFRLACLGRGW